MYCILEIKSSLLKKPYWIDKKQYDKVINTLDKASDLLDSIELFSFFVESYEELKNWCEHAEVNAEHIMSNRHFAERKCRGLLLELKTYFLQMKSKLGRKYGEDSPIYKMFINAEDSAKLNDAAFSLAMDLKECANHCNEIIHSFVAPNKKIGIQPCSIPATLLSNFNGWTKNNKKYLKSFSGNIDLMEIFASVYEVLKKIQLQIIEYFLKTNCLTEELLEIRGFMDSYFIEDNCTCFHLAHMVYQNKKDAPKVVFYQKKVSVIFEAYPIDWKVLYDLTDLLKEGNM